MQIVSSKGSCREFDQGVEMTGGREGGQGQQLLGTLGVHEFYALDL